MAQNDHDIEGCKMEGQRAPIQQAQCRFPGLAVSNAKLLIYIFQIKYTQAILSNNTPNMLIAV